MDRQKLLAEYLIFIGYNDDISMDEMLANSENAQDILAIGEEMDKRFIPNACYSQKEFVLSVRDRLLQVIDYVLNKYKK